MPRQFFTDIERERLNRFPNEIAYDDIIIYFTLSAQDMETLPIRSADYNRLGFALQLCTLRYLGFSPGMLTTVPNNVIDHIAYQLEVNPDILAAYGNRTHTRTNHLQEIQSYLGYSKANIEELKELSEWLLQRALEHDKPTLLFHMACEKLHSDKIVRPGITSIERMVMTARRQAQEKIYACLNQLLTEERKTFLDNILICDNTTGRTPLFWLRQGATANNPKAILNDIEKLSFLKEGGVDNWDITFINSNKRKFLAQIGQKSTNQALQRSEPQRRYPILVTFLCQIFEEITDEVVDLFDRCLANSYARAKRALDTFRLATAKTTNEKLTIFLQIGRILLDPSIRTLEELHKLIHKHVSLEKLRDTVGECDSLIRPKDDKHYDFLVNRYSYIRKFASKFLDALRFRSNTLDDPLLESLNLLRQVNSEGIRKLPADVSLKFVPKSWIPYVIDKSGEVRRRYYELCFLSELRMALRAGNIWIENSRRYADPETYLIPKKQWATLRPEVCRLLGVPAIGEQRLKQRQNELEKLLSRVDKGLPDNSNVSIKNGKLSISSIKAEELPESRKHLQDLITERLPRIDLVDLLIEVDGWCHFTDNFEHAGGSQPRTKELLTCIFASILAQACNFGLTKMAEISGLSYSQLTWHTNWYLREETLQKSINSIVNFQHHQPLSQYWGGGTLSSSDGQRFPVPVKTQNATALPRYFGYGRGLTFYSWTSDQFSQYGSKVIPTTMRDATYVLDAILDNETELQIVEHTTDTAGYTELVFALFDLLGMQFSPRIRDLADKKLYRIDKTISYKHLEPLLKGKINCDRILKNWDDILRIVASIKLGWVTASLFISKLQSYPRQNVLTKALQEYGHLSKTIFILKYLESEKYRRRIGTQLNKGEALHALRQFLLFANEGKIRKAQLEDQGNQASCLTLLTNAVIIWNTRYIQAVIDQLRAEGITVLDSDITHISPCRFEHINKYGKYTFNVDKELHRMKLRSLRRI